MKMHETGPTVYSPCPRRLESLPICWFNYKGSTFYSVILRPWLLVRPKLNSRPPAWQPDVQPTEPSVRSDGGESLKWPGIHHQYPQNIVKPTKLKNDANSMRSIHAIIFHTWRLKKLPLSNASIEIPIILELHCSDLKNVSFSIFLTGLIWPSATPLINLDSPVLHPHNKKITIISFEINH